MSLIPLNSIVLKSLSPDEAAAIEAGNNIKIKHYGEEQLKDRIFLLIDYLIISFGADAGKWGSSEKSIFAEDLRDTFARSYPNLAYEELLEAVKAWISGKINKDCFHISTRNVCMAVNEWQQVVRKEAIAKKNKELEERENQISEEKKAEWAEIFKADLLGTFKIYRESRTLPDDESYLASFYDYMDKNGYRLSTEIKIKIKEEVEQEMQSKQERKYVAKIHLGDFIKARDRDVLIKSKCKALVYVFDWLINNDKEIEL